MRNVTTQYVLWVARDGAEEMTDEDLRYRAGVAGSELDVVTQTLRGWELAQIPAGSRSEAGAVLTEMLNISRHELPAAGRVFLISEV